MGLGTRVFEEGREGATRICALLASSVEGSDPEQGRKEGRRRREEGQRRGGVSTMGWALKTNSSSSEPKGDEALRDRFCLSLLFSKR